MMQSSFEKDLSVIPDKINAYTKIVELLNAEVKPKFKPNQFAYHPPAIAKAYFDKPKSGSKMPCSSGKSEHKSVPRSDKKIK